MKKIIFSLLMLSGILTSHAQSDKYLNAMKRTLAFLDTAKTGEDLQKASNDMERIANAEKTQWLPYYHAAYALVMKSYQEKDTKNIDPLMDKADQLLASAEALTQNNSEVTTMKAMTMQCRMMVDWSRGMTLGPKCTQLTKLAETQTPADNPRAVLMEAQMIYNTPEAFGGSKAKGVELMKKAVALYDTFKPESDIHPNWGKAYAEQTLAAWSK